MKMYIQSAKQKRNYLPISVYDIELSNEECRRIAYRTQNPEYLYNLANHPDYLVRREVAKNKSTPSNILDILSRDSSRLVADTAKLNPNYIQPTQLDKPTKSRKPSLTVGERIDLAASADTPKEKLMKLVNDKSFSVLDVLSTKCRDSDVLRALFNRCADRNNYNYNDVIERIAENKYISDNLFNDIIDYLLVKLPYKALRILAKRNLLTIDIINNLSDEYKEAGWYEFYHQDNISDDLRKEAESHLNISRYANYLAGESNLSDELANKLYNYSKDTTGTYNCKYEILYKLYKNPSISEQLKQAIFDKLFESDYFRKLFASQPISSEILDDLATDNNPDVRYCVAKNPNTSLDTLEILTFDPNEKVKREALYQYSERNV